MRDKTERQLARDAIYKGFRVLRYYYSHSWHAWEDDNPGVTLCRLMKTGESGGSITDERPMCKICRERLEKSLEENAK